MATSTVTVYTAKEAADILRCNKETVYRWARANPPKIGFCPRQPGQSGYRFLQKHIDDFLNGIPPETVPQEPKPKRHPRYAGK